LLVSLFEFISNKNPVIIKKKKSHIQEIKKK